MGDILSSQAEQLSTITNENTSQRGQEIIQNEMLAIKQQSIADKKLIYGPSGDFVRAVAPNGEQSHLSEKQWLHVRTKTFKQWFGDWEQERETASKIVDENGEPLVVYHGTTRNFNKFDANAPKTYEEMDNTKGLFYVSSGRKFAEREYASFKLNLVGDMLRDFNDKFFSGKEKEWSPLVDKWNDFIWSIGTERVNFHKKVSDGRGGYFGWTVVEFDGKEIFATDEIDKLWDKKLPSVYKEEDYDKKTWGGTEILMPKNSTPVMMELFINSRRPIYKQMRENAGPQEMDDLFSAGLIEKGINLRNEKHIEKSPKFASQPAADSIIVKASKTGFALGFFQPNQAKSAANNNGSFSTESDNILE